MRQDFQKITTHVERLTGLVSRWNGMVHVSEEVDIDGKPRFTARKDMSCSLTAHQAFLLHPDLFGTLVHESLHSVSAGLTRSLYTQFRGYEEGVVEMATRLLGPPIAEALGMSFDFEVRVSFEDYLALLEALRAKTDRDEATFYLSLLKTPLAQREQTVVQWIMETSPETPRARVLAHIAPLLRGLK